MNENKKWYLSKGVLLFVGYVVITIIYGFVTVNQELINSLPLSLLTFPMGILGGFLIFGWQAIIITAITALFMERFVSKNQKLPIYIFSYLVALPFIFCFIYYLSIHNIR